MPESKFCNPSTFRPKIIVTNLHRTDRYQETTVQFRHFYIATKMFLHTISCAVCNYKNFKCILSFHAQWLHVHYVQQKSRSLKFRTSRAGSDVTYSCHSSRFTFPIFVHSWRFSVFHSLQSITPRILLTKDTNTFV